MASNEPVEQIKVSNCFTCPALVAVDFHCQVYRRSIAAEVVLQQFDKPQFCKVKELRVIFDDD